MAIETKEIITFCIALYGAALSSFVFYRSLVRDRRRIVVKQTTGFYTYLEGLGPPIASIEVTKHGHRPVVVSAQRQCPRCGMRFSGLETKFTTAMLVCRA